MKYILLLFLIPILGQSIQAQQDIQLTYIGNMGVLINDQKQSILIDGLHKKYQAYYQYPSNELVKKIIANKDFPEITVLLQTHIHKDHFDPELVSQFLKNNTNAILIGPPQSKEAILKTNSIKNSNQRLKTIDYKQQTKHILKHKSIQVTGFYLNHAGAARHSQTENIGYLININGKKILHVGDTGWNEDLFEALDLEKEGIDVAILPNWLAMYEEGIEVINKYIQPQQIVATHISPFEKETVTKGIKKHFPNAVMFTEIGQEIQITQ